MPKAHINGLELHYQIAGDGFPLVLVHGLATNLAFWYLSSFWPLTRDYRTMAYDLRGHGRSGTPPEGYTTTDLAADLQGLLDHLGIEACHLVGHSYGGAVALHLATTQPHRVRSLTLADAWIPALRTARPRHQWRFRHAWEERLRQWDVDVSEETFRAGLPLLDQLVEMGGAAEPAPQPLAQGGRRRDIAGRIANLPSRSNTSRQWQALLKNTSIAKEIVEDCGLTRKKISELRAPTLVIFGRRSRWLGICEALEQSIPDARVVKVPGAGHFHPFAKPEFFQCALRDFLGLQEADARDGSPTRSKRAWGNLPA